MAPPDVSGILSGLQSDQAQARKLAAYNLQSALNKDDSFAESFAKAGGLPILRRTILDERGNTLAYALGSFNQFLQLGLGWGQIEKSIVSLAIDLVVSRAVINVLRNALLLLVLVVTRAPSREPLDLSAAMPPSSHDYDYATLTAALEDHPDFIGCLVDKFSSADHELCENALRLVNALLADAIATGRENEWPAFSTRLRDEGILGEIETIMRGNVAGDLVEHVSVFQDMYASLMTRWKALAVNMDIAEHRKALLSVQQASIPQNTASNRASAMLSGNTVITGDDTIWRRIGFSTEEPTQDFKNVGLLGLLDLVQYVHANPASFQFALSAQNELPGARRCPVAQASLFVTGLLYDHFSIETFAAGSVVSDQVQDREVLRSRLRPAMLRWNTLHAAATSLFQSLWSEAEAELDEFDKIQEIVELHVSTVLNNTARNDDMSAIGHEIQNATLPTLRAKQSAHHDDSFNQTWGDDLEYVHWWFESGLTLTIGSRLQAKCHDEALQIMQDQRIGCLSAGAWFPVVKMSATEDPSNTSNDAMQANTRCTVSSWRYLKLSAGRRHLHHALHTKRLNRDPELSEMPKRIDVQKIRSIVSSVSKASFDTGASTDGNAHAFVEDTTLTQLRIVGIAKGATSNQESDLLELYTPDQNQASEWIDGLLMLLNQQPITAQTHDLIRLVQDTSVKARLASLTLADQAERERRGKISVPTRIGINHDFWYANETCV